MNNAKRFITVEALIESLEHLFSAGASPQLLVERSIDLTFESQAVSIYTIELVLNQDNEFSQSAKDLDITDTEEPIVERFIRIWTALDMKDLTISLQLNPLEYSNYLTNACSSSNPQAVSIFNDWLNFYRSNDVKALLNVLCFASHWTYIPKDLFMLFAQHFSDNPMQIKLI